MFGDVPSHKFDMRTLPTDITHQLKNSVKNSKSIIQEFSH